MDQTTLDNLNQGFNMLRSLQEELVFTASRIETSEPLPFTNKDVAEQLIKLHDKLQEIQDHLWRGVGGLTNSPALEFLARRKSEASLLEVEPPYFSEGCTCRAIPISELGRTVIGGEDDCPVHGFSPE